MRKQEVLAVLMVFGLALLVESELYRDGSRQPSSWHSRTINSSRLYDLDAAADPTTTVNAFILSHSHCDPGWLETVNYYSMWNVSKIIDNVVQYLQNDPNKRFIWSESVFLEMWWNNRTEKQRQAFKSLVDKKQIEIVGGGWVMNDEACPTYSSIIDQMTQGHQFINQKLGVSPQVGWQIDPFGASRTFAYLVHEMGFKHHVINRIDERLKHKFSSVPGSGGYIKEKNFEFFWCGSKSSPDSCIFTHVLDHHYTAPEICDDNGCTGFDFEGDPTVNPPITDENIDSRATLLVQYIRNVSESYRTNNFLVPFGNDFRFQKAGLMFDNMDKLITYINKNKSRFNINIQYSTLAEYFEAVGKSSTPSQFPVKTPSSEVDYPDYFPYATCWGSDYDSFDQDCTAYWSGFFTSEPQFKKVVREGERFLRSCEFIYALSTAELYQVETYLNRNVEKDMHEAGQALQQLRNALALALHHDAITGTEKRFVMKNYTNIIQNATDHVISKTNLLFDYLSLKSEKYSSLNLTIDDSFLLDQSNKIYSLSLFNSLGWTTSEYVKIKVKSRNLVVFELSRDTNTIRDVQSDVIADLDGQLTLHFKATIPPVGFTTYFILQNDFNVTKNEDPQPQQTLTMENGYISLQFVLGDNGKLPYVLKYITNKVSGITTSISQQLMQYTSYGDGAYIFRPKEPAQPLPLETEYLSYSYTKGNVIQALHQRLTNNVTQTFILYNENDNPENGLHFDIITNAKTADNQEMINRFTINGQTELYTDSNSYEMINRVYNPVKFNDTKLFNEISGNYYPMVESSFIRDSTNNIQVTLYSMEAMGVSSTSNGSIEVMLNRNTLTDDDRGLGENLNVTISIASPLRVSVGPITESNNFRPRIAKLFNNPSLKMFSTSISLPTLAVLSRADVENAVQKYAQQYSIYNRFANELPPNVHLLSLQSRNNDSDVFTVLRLQHIYEVRESLVFSRPVTMYAESIFDYYDLSDVSERSLSLTSVIDNNFNLSTVEMKPGKIRTFSLKMWRQNQGDTWFSISSFLFGAAGMTVILMLVIVAISVGINCSSQSQKESNRQGDMQYDDENVGVHFERDDYEEVK